MRQKIYDVPVGEEALYGTCFHRVAWLLHRSGEHKSLFDKESIIAKVRLSGFEYVTTRGHDPIADADARFSSVHMVAKK